MITTTEQLEDIEAWLEVPVDGFASRSEAIDCCLSETGATTEGNFCREAEYEARYEAWRMKTLKDLHEV